MTNTLTKQQVDEVIEKLVDKSLTFGCRIFLEPHDYAYNGPHVIAFQRGETYTAYAEEYSLGHDMEQTVSMRHLCAGRAVVIKQVLGHPILIGDVLFLDERKASMAPSWGEELLKVWPAEWRKQSLQEIAGRIEYKKECPWCRSEPVSEACGFTTFEYAKPSPEADLLLFLYNLFDLTK